MSWIDLITNDIVITCGDGKSYSPSWLNATKQIEWNVSEFTFPELDGTFVKKSKKLGTKYSLELYFQGPDHLEQSMAFETSANNPRPWTIQHPFYGQLIVQAPSFNIDNSGLNVSKWTGVVIETIVEDNPRTTLDPIDAIAIQKNLLDESFAQALLLPPSAADVTQMAADNKKNFDLTVPIIKIPEESAKYFDLFNKANSAISTATAGPLLAMRQMIAMISAPAQFTITTTNRVNLLNNQFISLRQNVEGLFNPASKQIYQNLAGSILSTMCLVASLPLPGDFTNNKQALLTIDKILGAYNTYIADLDGMSSSNGGGTGSFIPDPTSLQSLNQLLNLALANLIQMALSAKSERTIITENDTNIIILTHRFYGLDANDNNINELMENNELGLNSMLQIRKGTKIVYYV